MKRSQVNAIIKEALDFAGQMNFKLPPFAYWKWEDYLRKGKEEEYREFFDNMLGWDVTDFGHGNFEKCGLLMLCIRNGNFFKKEYAKKYAEKMLVAQEGQVTPYHHHSSKMEDIINRGGGNLIVKLYNADEQDRFADTPVLVSMDGRNHFVPAGTEIRARPGESITLHNRVYHSFWAEPSCGKVLLGEVSSVNDDTVDNHFYETTGRFPEIEEDEPIQNPVLMDYRKLFVKD